MLGLCYVGVLGYLEVTLLLHFGVMLHLQWSYVGPSLKLLWSYFRVILD